MLQGMVMEMMVWWVVVSVLPSEVEQVSVTPSEVVPVLLLAVEFSC